MRNAFVQTQNAKNLLSALGRLQNRGAEEACLMVVDGAPGLGKSDTLRWWATVNGAALLRAKKEWTPAWAMRELITVLGGAPEHSFEKMFSQALGLITQNQALAAAQGEFFAIIIDEADYVARKEALPDSFRDLSDMVEVPVVFVGMGRVRQAFTRFPQVASRVAQYVTFEPASLVDVQALVGGLCEVPVHADLTALLHKLSKGYPREIKEGIATIERHGRRNPGEAVTIEAMAGQVLLNDRASGKPQVVPGRGARQEAA